MIYYFIYCKKVGFACDSCYFLPYDDVGKFLFENQYLNGYDKLQIFRIERRGPEMKFTVYLFNQFIFPPMEELLEAMSAFLDVPSEEITLRFFSEKEVNHD